jgi:L,D-transpeptidase catalytic domain
MAKKKLLPKRSAQRSPRSARTKRTERSRTKQKPQLKRSRQRSTRAAKRKRTKPSQRNLTLSQRLTRARKLEALDARKPAFETSRQGALAAPQASAAHPFRNDDFPNTYIQQISVSLDDPDHSLTLSWTGSNSNAQQTGPFKTSPGAGLIGLNCDDEVTSRRSGSKCTPKGTYPVQGFQRRLNSDSRAMYVTWFMQSRGVALHYFPIVPDYAASHGCVRIEAVDVARLIQDNSLVGDTKVVVSGTWTKPPKQWP